MDKTKILWTGPINGLGYGQASAGYAAGLLHHGALAGHVNIGNVDPKDPEIAYGECSSKLLKTNLVGSPRHNEDDIPSAGFWHFTHSQEIAQGSPRVIMSTFEVDDFPPPIIQALEGFDAIGTASTWGEEILRQRFPNKTVFSSPHAYSVSGDHEKLKPLGKKERVEQWAKHLGVNLPEDTQILGNVGKYEVRKGHREILDTVLDIGRERPVLLIAAWFNPFMRGNYPFFAFHMRDMAPVVTKSPMFLYRKDKALVAVAPRMQTKEGLLQVIRNTDTYLSPSYCEGWDLPLFEMMSHGAHCIASLNTAHLDYCTDDNCTVLDGSTIEQAKDDTPFFSGRGTWNRCNSEELRHCIDKAYKMSEEERVAIGLRAEKDCRKFTWAKSASKIIQTVEKLQEENSATTIHSGKNA